MSTEAFIPYIKAVGRGERLKRDLTYEESVEAMRLIARQEATDAQIGAFLIAQRVKGEAIDEIVGFTQVLREEFIDQFSPKVDGLLDLAVPYDGKVKTAQLAPAIAIILAEAGVPVVLHGDEGVPTKEGVGPGQVFEVLGIPSQLDPPSVSTMIEQVGIGYLSAAQFSPAWHNLLPLRRQFGLRTVLNTVEKLFNPANAPYQISGFFHANYIDRLRPIQTGTQMSWMVQGEEGSIEMAAGRKSHIFAREAKDDLILDPVNLGLPGRERIAVVPIVTEHAKLNAQILAGERGHATDQVVLTTATILYLLGAATDITTGMTQVDSILASGRAQRRLEKAKANPKNKIYRSVGSPTCRL